MIENSIDKISGFINKAFLLFMILIMVYPFWFICVGALNDGQDYMQGGVFFWPRKWSFDNIRTVFLSGDIVNAFKVTILKCLIGTITSVFFTCLVSWGLTRPTLKYKNIYLSVMMLTMFFSGGLIPYFLLIKNLQLYNHFLVYIIPTLFSVWNMIIIQSFMRELPSSIIESAKIDGASEYCIFIRMVIPLCKPVIAAIALFTIVGHWNSFFDSLMYTSSNSLQTIQLYLKKVITDPSVAGGLGSQVAMIVPDSAAKITAQSVKMAAMMVTALPVVAIYPFLQKYFVQGMTIGAIKG